MHDVLPKFLRALPAASPMPPVDRSKSYQTPAPPGFQIIDQTNLPLVFGSRVKVLRTWFEPTTQPLAQRSFANIVWLRSILDGSVPFLNVPSADRRIGTLTIGKRDFVKDQFHEH
jgi:hypothetical protein